MKKYYRVMLGSKSIEADECYKGNFIGADFGIEADLTKETLLVVELKRGRVSDNVVGQILRYMGYVKEELAEAGQEVKGVIIGLEADIRLKRALAVMTNIEFYKYQVSFKLYKQSDFNAVEPEWSVLVDELKKN